MLDKMTKERRDRIRKVIGLVAQVVLVLIALITVVVKSTGSLQANTYDTKALEVRVTRIDSTQKGVLEWKVQHTIEAAKTRRNSEVAVGYLEILLEAQGIPYPKAVINN